MKFLDLLRNYEIYLSGSFAIYALMCMGYVTLVGTIQIVKWVRWMING